MITSAPASARRRAVAAPIPLLPPVMTASRPARMSLSLIGCFPVVALVSIKASREALSPEHGTTSVRKSRCQASVENETHQLVLRRDAEPGVGALLIGKDGVQPDTEFERYPLRCDATDDGGTYVGLARSQGGSGRGETFTIVSVRIGPARRLVIGVTTHQCEHEGSLVADAMYL